VREDGSSAGTICYRLGKTGQVPLADVGTLAGIAVSAPIPRCRQESSPTHNRWHDRLLKDSGWSGSWIRWLFRNRPKMMFGWGLEFAGHDPDSSLIAWPIIQQPLQ